MAQVLSTFSRLEQSRFEAFRRSTFPRDVISKYVAHCIMQRSHVLTSNKQPSQPILSHMCAPGQAEEITIVVNTLAKAYAQRLVTAARRLAPEEVPIQPKHILQAFEERKIQGLDPGFFLQPAETTTTIVLQDDDYTKKRMATMCLQDEYDKLHPEQRQAEEEERAAQIEALQNVGQQILSFVESSEEVDVSRLVTRWVQATGAKIFDEEPCHY